MQIYDASPAVADWLPFKLWPAQEETLQALLDNRLLVILKARQLGFSWLVLGYALWLMLFRPASTILIFSKRDDEAVELLDFRLKGMYDRLPVYMRLSSETDGQHQWLLSNGSRAMAFPTTGGRSYTGTFVIVDEADFVPNLDKLLNAVKPTIDAGGRMALLSTPDKDQPQSSFKRIFLAAQKQLNAYKHIFFGWRARPDRDERWYEEQKQDILARTTALDDLHQEYPDTVTEALAPRSLNKRIPSTWIEHCYTETDPLDLPPAAPSLPGLSLYRIPRFGEHFTLGADPAEGNPTSDDSSFTVLDKVTGEEAAVLAGKVEPGVFAAYIKVVANYFNKAGTLVERNNHGHAVLMWLGEHAQEIPLLTGDDGRVGWLSSTVGKTTMYDNAAEAFRLGDTRLHSQATYTQLASIEGATLRAPDGQYDDRADGYALALLARSRKPYTTHQSNYMQDDHRGLDDEEERDQYYG